MSGPEYPRCNARGSTDSTVGRLAGLRRLLAYADLRDGIDHVDGAPDRVARRFGIAAWRQALLAT
jgi:hypothetical protein